MAIRRALARDAIEIIWRRFFGSPRPSLPLGGSRLDGLDQQVEEGQGLLIGEIELLKRDCPGYRVHAAERLVSLTSL